MLFVLASSPAVDEVGPDTIKQMAMLNVCEKVQVCVYNEAYSFSGIVSMLHSLNDEKCPVSSVFPQFFCFNFLSDFSLSVYNEYSLKITQVL